MAQYIPQNIPRAGETESNWATVQNLQVIIFSDNQVCCYWSSNRRVECILRVRLLSSEISRRNKPFAMLLSSILFLHSLRNLLRLVALVNFVQRCLLMLLKLSVKIYSTRLYSSDILDKYWTSGKNTNKIRLIELFINIMLFFTVYFLSIINLTRQFTVL